MTAVKVSALAPPLTDVVETGTGQRLFVGVWPGDGPTFVFAPGLTSNHRNIAGVAAALDGEATVVSIDLRGRGCSTKPPPGNYGIETHAQDVLAVMDELGIAQAFIGGHSMGAYVATAAAVRSPGRCQGLVLVDGGVFVPSPDLPDPDELWELALKPVVDRLNTVFPSVEAYRAFWADSPYLELGAIAEGYLRYDLGLVAGGFRPKCSYEAALEDWRDLFRNPETVARLGRVTCPVLAVGAEAGLTEAEPPVLGEAHLDHLRSQVAALEFVRVPDTTHHTVTLSDVGALGTAGALSKFLRRVVETPARPPEPVP